MPYKDKEQEKRWKADDYHSNKAFFLEKTRNRRRKTAAWLKSIKLELKCIRCGETHVSCLHFHHRDPSQKIRNIAFMSHSGWSREAILKEIAKCDVLCANCHCKVHDELADTGK